MKWVEGETGPRILSLALCALIGKEGREREKWESLFLIFLGWDSIKLETELGRGGENLGCGQEIPNRKIDGTRVDIRVVDFAGKDTQFRRNVRGPRGRPAVQIMNHAQQTPRIPV